MSTSLPCAFSAFSWGSVKVPNGTVTSSPSTVAGRKFIGGEPMKPATNRFRGLVVELAGRGELLQDTATHDGDPVTQRHSLGLVVGHVDRRDAQALLQTGDLRAHLTAELGVQVRQGLIEQERLGVPDDRTSHRNPLALTT